MLTDQEIILRAKQTPQKLKDSYNKLLRKLDKNNIKLNNKGQVNNYLIRLTIIVLKMTG
jgi:hypothetical protein